jgi:hypothetical protein
MIMETSIMLKLFESIGFPAVIFVIWYIYHNAQVKTFVVLAVGIVGQRDGKGDIVGSQMGAPVL